MSEYERLKKLYLQTDLLIADKVTSSHSSFKVWKNSTERLIIRHYGSDSVEYKQFCKIHFAPQAFFGGETESDYISYCLSALETVKGMLAEFVEEWEDDSMQNKKFNPKRAFIVHGHDELLKQKAARMLEQQGIEAIILHEQPNAGKTIIEKIEHYRDVGVAIILFTPDDSGKANKESDYKARARQNVVFEAGYFIGYLGRNRVVIIKSDHSIEMPGDLQGMVYTSTDPNWQYEVIGELREMGLDVTKDKVKC